MAAASRDCPDIAEELLRTGCCDVARADAEGFTALHYLKLGEKAGTVSIVRRLLQCGAPVNAQDFGGRTPLHWASGWSWASYDVVSELLKSPSTDTMLRDNYGYTAFDRAREHGHFDILALLEQHANQA